jgi:hypothetical protein
MEEENNMRDLNIEEIKKEFLDTMDMKTKKALEIAKNHLESSFDLEKCISFQKFLNKKQKNKK